jgi:hypothetical protein
VHSPWTLGPDLTAVWLDPGAPDGAITPARLVAEDLSAGGVHGQGLYRPDPARVMTWVEQPWRDPRMGVDPSRLGGYAGPMMADPDPSRRNLLLRLEQTRAQSQALREQVAELAEAIAEVELDVARVQEGIAVRGGSLAAQAREHAERAREFAAREHAEAVRLRRLRRTEACWPEGATSAPRSTLGIS